jgi:hypothetical protein
MVPKSLRMKAMDSGEKFDRYEALDKRQTLALLEPLTLKSRYYDFDEFHRFPPFCPAPAAAVSICDGGCLSSQESSR